MRPMDENRPPKTDPDDFETLLGDGIQKNRDQHTYTSGRSRAALVIDLPAGKRAAPPLVPAGTRPSESQMDKSTLKKLKQGQFTIDRTVDLHGYTFDAARRLFRQVIEEGYQKNHRCLLIITGKGEIGKGDPADPSSKRGRIRESLKDWVMESPCASYILHYTAAQQHHGGTGAFYILLRRQRD